MDSAKNQAHSNRLTRCQANHCPFWVFLVDYFFTFSMSVTTSDAQDASFRSSPHPRIHIRRNSMPTRQQVLPYSQCPDRSRRTDTLDALHQRCILPRTRPKMPFDIFYLFFNSLLIALISKRKHYLCTNNVIDGLRRMIVFRTL